MKPEVDAAELGALLVLVVAVAVVVVHEELSLGYVRVEYVNLHR